MTVCSITLLNFKINKLVQRRNFPGNLTVIYLKFDSSALCGLKWPNCMAKNLKTCHMFSHEKSHAVFHQHRRLSGFNLPMFFAKLLNISFSGLPYPEKNSCSPMNASVNSSSAHPPPPGLTPGISIFRK